MADCLQGDRKNEHSTNPENRRIYFVNAGEQPTRFQSQHQSAIRINSVADWKEELKESSYNKQPSYQVVTRHIAEESSLMS